MELKKVIHLDLIFVSVLMVLAGILIYAFPGSDIFRFVLAVILQFFIPGYLLSVLLFSKKDQISKSDLILSSFGTSTVLNGVIFLLVTYTFGLDAEIIFWTISIVVGLLLVMVIIRRAPLTGNQMSGFVLQPNVSNFFQPRKISTMVVLNTTLLLIVFGMFVWLFLTDEATQPQFTEFYVLDANKEIFDYSVKAIDSDPFSVHYEIINQEGENVTYGVVAYVSGDIVGAAAPIVVANGEMFEGELEIVIPEPGQHLKLELKLLREGFSEPIRELHTWVDVAPESPE